MRDHAGRLIHDHNRLVFVDYLQRERYCTRPGKHLGFLQRCPQQPADHDLPSADFERVQKDLSESFQ